MTGVQFSNTPQFNMNRETTAIRTPTALQFDRLDLAVSIQKIEKNIKLREVELAKLRGLLEEKQRKMNQLALIAIGRLRKR